ncbi:MAG: hypothetical protein U5K84_07155 [Alkalibacterium sp.]|nr:hypothetical protein [Alkalibacterium sp.]
MKIGLNFVVDYNSRFESLLSLAVLATVGIGIYGFLALKTRLADRLVGAKAASVRRRLKMN